MLHEEHEMELLTKRVNCVSSEGTLLVQSVLLNKRPFPKGKEESGNVCIICDRKFYIYAMYKDYRNKLYDLEKDLKDREEVFELVEGDFNSVSKEYERQKECNQKQIDSHKDNIAHLEAQVNDCNVLKIRLKEDINSNQLLINRKNEEIEEYNQKITDNKTKILETDDELVELNNKINHLCELISMERPKLEHAEAAAAYRQNQS